MSTFATGGSGSQGSPWTGWDTSIAWTGSQTYFFPKGHYSYSTAPNWAHQEIRLLGEGGTVLVFGGTGNAVVFDGGASGAGVVACFMQDFVITGNANATNGVFLRAIHHSTFRNILVTNVSAAGLRTQWNVLNHFADFRVSTNEGGYTTIPVNGVVLDRRGAGETTSACAFFNPIFEGLSGSGILLTESGASNNTFVGGTSEGNGRGVQISAGCERNVFYSIDCEANSIEDILVDGRSNAFHGGYYTNRFHVTGTSSTGNELIAGQCDTITIDAGVVGTLICGTVYGILGGVLTDNGIGTTVVAVRSLTTGTIHQRFRQPVSIYDAAVSDEAYQGMLRITRPPASGQYINLLRAGNYPWSIGTVYNDNRFAIGTGQAVDSDFDSPYFMLTIAGSVLTGSTPIATNGTDGFLYIRTTSGTPTGTPNSWNGVAPIVFDTSNNRLWVYNGAWKSVALS